MSIKFLTEPMKSRPALTAERLRVLLAAEVRRLKEKERPAVDRGK